MSTKETAKKYYWANREKVLIKRKAKRVLSPQIRSVKQVGDPCARCKMPLTVENGLNRGKGRRGLYCYCRHCHNEKCREERLANPERVKTRAKKNRAKVRNAVLDAYGRRCACCGETRWQFLAIDHVNGGGNIHRRSGMSNPYTLGLFIIKNNFPSDFQVLCHNCNQAKGYYGKCPHQEERELGAA